MTEYDVYDVVLAPCSYLYTFWQILSSSKSTSSPKLPLDASGFTTCCVVEMTWVNMPDSYNNFRWAVTASTDTFGCQQSSLTMFWGWWDHTFYVYQLCTWLCMCRDVRRRTTLYDVVRSRSNRTRAKYRSHSHYARCRTTVRRRTCVPAHAQPRTQLVDVKCVVPPAPEQSNCFVDIRKYPWKLSLCSRSSCTNLAYSAKSSRRRSTSWTQKRRRRVYFDDKKICQTREDNY